MSYTHMIYISGFHEGLTVWQLSIALSLVYTGERASRLRRGMHCGHMCIVYTQRTYYVLLVLRYGSRGE